MTSLVNTYNLTKIVKEMDNNNYFPICLDEFFGLTRNVWRVWFSCMNKTNQVNQPAPHPTRWGFSPFSSTQETHSCSQLLFSPTFRIFTVCLRKQREFLCKIWRRYDVPSLALHSGIVRAVLTGVFLTAVLTARQDGRQKSAPVLTGSRHRP